MELHDPHLETAGGTDPVSSFGDREALFLEVEDALRVGSRTRVLAVYDLSGLDEYRQVHGQIAADQLVQRLARRFRGALGSRARCFRARADELWALVDAAADEAQPLLLEAARALHDEGAAALVTASFGTAVLPDATDDPMDALMLADSELGAARRARERRRSARD